MPSPLSSALLLALFAFIAACSSSGSVRCGSDRVVCPQGDGTFVCIDPRVACEGPNLPPGPASVDLSVNLEPTLAAVSGELGLRILVSNAGPDRAPDLLVTTEFPSGASLLSSSVYCRPDGPTRVDCLSGSPPSPDPLVPPASGETASFTLTFDVATSPSGDFAVAASCSDCSDLDDSNDSATWALP